MIIYFMRYITFKVLNILFGIAFYISTPAFGQKIFLQNEKTGKMVELDKKRAFGYVLKSDSILFTDSTKKSVDLPKEYAKAEFLQDSFLILEGGYKLTLSDVEFIEQLPRKTFIAQRNSSPILVFGLAVFTRGLIMLPEGFESKNSYLIPVQILGGGLIAGVSSLPFWKKPKRYYLSDWTVVQTN